MLPFIFLILIHSGAFVEYYTTAHIIPSNSVVSNLIIEQVVDVFPNSTFDFNLTVVFLNFSEISPPSYVLDNLTCPSTFFFLPHPGAKVIPREVPLTLLNYSNGTYVYEGSQNVEGVTIKYYYFVNSSGVPSKIEIFQYSVSGTPVSETVYKLIASNLVNPSETPYIPKGLHQEKGIAINFQGPNYYLGQYVVLFNLLAIPTIIFLRRKIARR